MMLYNDTHIQKFFQSCDPWLPVSTCTSSSEPDKSWLNMPVFWRRTETKARIWSYDALVLLILWLSIFESLKECKKHQGEKSGKERVVDDIEYRYLNWKCTFDDNVHKPLYLLQLPMVLPRIAPVSGLYRNCWKEVSSGFLANANPTPGLLTSAPVILSGPPPGWPEED